jgi:hypothetical protein
MVPSSVTSTQPRWSRCMARMASVTVDVGESVIARRTGRTVSDSRSSPASKPSVCRFRVDSR